MGAAKEGGEGDVHRRSKIHIPVGGSTGTSYLYT